MIWILRLIVVKKKKKSLKICILVLSMVPECSIPLCCTQSLHHKIIPEEGIAVQTNFKHS